jgi:hypothetical protein
MGITEKGAHREFLESVVIGELGTIIVRRKGRGKDRNSWVRFLTTGSAALFG